MLQISFCLGAAVTKITPVNHIIACQGNGIIDSFSESL